MRNSLEDLHNHLFAQLERLNDEELQGDKLADEIERSKAVTAVASRIIENGQLVLAAEKYKSSSKMDANASLPKMLENKK